MYYWAYSINIINSFFLLILVRVENTKMSLPAQASEYLIGYDEIIYENDLEQRLAITELDKIINEVF